MVASEDYKAALTIFETLHDDSAKSWRQLAGVQSQITIALEVVPDERSNALKYAESAMASAQKALEKYKAEDAQNPEIQTLAEVIEDIAVKVCSQIFADFISHSSDTGRGTESSICIRCAASRKSRREIHCKSARGHTGQ